METEEWVTGNIALKVKGRPLEMELTVPAMPVKPHRMLPIFHQMANSLVDIGVEEVTRSGKKISCKAGCGACCRQPVPISETEVYQIAELVESMPEPRRSEIKRRFAEGVEHFRKIGWFDKFKEVHSLALAEQTKEAAAKAVEIVTEYFYEGIPCPFLEAESCSIHPSRPVACREYLVTTPAENCAKPTADTVKIIDLLIKPSRTLKTLGRTGQLDSLGLITLITALDIAETYPEKFAEKTGERWVAEFFENLTKTDIPEEGMEKKTG